LDVKPRLVCLAASLALLYAANFPRTVRVTGTIEPVKSFVVQAPVIQGQGGNLTLTKLVPNGIVVHKGELLAEFDEVKELQDLRDASAKYDDLSHQIFASMNKPLRWPSNLINTTNKPSISARFRSSISFNRKRR
jgi:multidrug efflux pump subunit AcrA (membrane-fusion protein)